jgi:fatty acid synthase subunit beta
MRHTILCEEDYDFFLDLCSKGGKPVNFIPIIDGDLSLWFKKDSLWYSEDLGGVPEADPGRVVVLQGPVAVHRTRRAHQPAADILREIEAQLKQHMKQEAYLDDEVGLRLELQRSDKLGTVVVTTDVGRRELHIPGGEEEDARATGTLPDAEAWLDAIASDHRTWLYGLVHTPFVISGRRWVDNPVLKLLAPRFGQRVMIEEPEKPQTLRLFDREFADAQHAVVEISAEGRDLSADKVPGTTR